ncbi:MAG: nucleoside-diphosphate kinase [Candidatus Magasanikbacteria bacterium RIFOXYD2_FULL_41_14]|uniref:Nucleoside diphosphate kinase n=1 Tax=Candidatus Magasanikbacteria bacterium RIFOXYD2_FULL_41_14 TaxID=1798709 RepID=A0A1F6PF83_9BACT|nr:MAG: nucleoside-diphosphate kinase [Candidatus Magasanikbacteria bacterium RIFOXYD2_FULL_41_14]
MARCRTLALIKPDGVSRGLIGKVIARIEDAGLRILQLQMKHVTKQEAEVFYGAHRGRPFYDALTEFTAAAPLVALVIEGDDAVTKWRAMMGATDPAKAGVGTIRGDFREKGAPMMRNVVHGSDSEGSATNEIGLFFPVR